MLSAQQINSFHMVATCCLANVGTQLANMEKICDPSYKCLEEKVEFVRMLLSEIQGFIPEGEEILPRVNITGSGGTAGDTIQFFVDGAPIMNLYTVSSGTFSDNIAALIEAIEDYSGFKGVVENGLYYLIAPEGTGDQYSNSVVTINTTGTLLVYGGNMSYGVDAIESNCISDDDAMIIIRRLVTLLNICSPLNSLPETVYITNPCGCN